MLRSVVPAAGSVKPWRHRADEPTASTTVHLTSQYFITKRILPSSGILSAIYSKQNNFINFACLSVCLILKIKLIHFWQLKETQKLVSQISTLTMNLHKLPPHILMPYDAHYYTEIAELWRIGKKLKLWHYESVMVIKRMLKTLGEGHR